MRKYKLFLLFILLIIPTVVFASSGDNGDFSIEVVVFMEIFCTLFMSLFVFKPLSMMLSKEKSKQLFWILFLVRVLILLFFDIFITPAICIVDFFGIFIGTFIIVPICAMITKTDINKVRSSQVIETANNNFNYASRINSDVTLKCTKCGGTLKVTDKFCINCGEPVAGNNGITSNEKVVYVNQYDSIFNNTEDKLLEEFINRELVKAGISDNCSLIPYDILKRKNILNIIFSILIFIFTSLIFFHFPIYTYIIGLIILFIFFKVTRNYNLMKYLKKEIKARPSEKISNIVMNVKNSFVNDNTKIVRICCILVAIVLPLLIFINPRIMYEKVDNGYAVRFYSFGLTNFRTATIPETYKGEPVTALRGNTFSNMPFLESVNLPDTITEIRGQAFKNDKNLATVNIPKGLEYLGGGAFYNCTSITRIELPDTLTYMGGETFYNASSLEYVKLSRNLTEIRGDSFEFCTSLRSIEIPDSVTRIGGHAFYGDTSLSEVVLTPNSQLYEIGSSAFRLCPNLYSIIVPRGVFINERAFKESPTSVYYFN